MRRMISDNQLNSLKAPDVIITGVPESAVQGTLTQEQIERLLANDKSRIIFNNEYYYLNDKFHKNGVLTYTHSGYDDAGIDKYLNITVTTREWVLTETNIGGGGNIKIIELNGNITQDQLDIIFPKDSSGNVYEPDYKIIIHDNSYIGINYYLTNYSINSNPQKTYVNFMSIPTAYNNTEIRCLKIYLNGSEQHYPTVSVRKRYQHNIYIKTNDLYIFLTIVGGAYDEFIDISSITDYLTDRQISCSGYLTASNGVITSLTYNSTDNKFYFSVNGDIDYAFFEARDVTQFVDKSFTI